MLLSPHYTLSRCLGAGVTSAPLGNLCTTNLWLVTRRAAPHRPGHVTGRRPRRLVLLWPGPLYVRTSYLGRWTRPGVRPEPGVSAPLSQVVGFTHANVQVRDCYLPSPRAGAPRLPNLKPVWASGSNFGSPRVSSGHKWGHGGAKLMWGLVPGQPGNSL